MDFEGAIESCDWDSGSDNEFEWGKFYDRFYFVT